QADDDAFFNPDGNLAHQDRRAHHQQREKHQIVEDAVPHRFPERIRGHCPYVLHFPLTSTAFACARSASTRFMKKSSSVGLICATERIRAPAARNCSIAPYNSSSGICTR